MYTTDEYQICRINKRELSLNQIHYADTYPIITLGDKSTGHYTIKIGETTLEYIGDSLVSSRIFGCNYLISECGYESDIFKSVCFTTYDRKPNPQTSYFKLVRK